MTAACSRNGRIEHSKHYRSAQRARHLRKFLFTISKRSSFWAESGGLVVENEAIMFWVLRAHCYVWKIRINDWIAHKGSELICKSNLKLCASRSIIKKVSNYFFSSSLSTSPGLVLMKFLGTRIETWFMLGELKANQHTRQFFDFDRLSIHHFFISLVRISNMLITLTYEMLKNGMNLNQQSWLFFNTERWWRMRRTKLQTSDL